MNRVILLIALILTVISSFYLYQSSSNNLERINLDVNRFDLELFSVNADNIDDKSRQWKQNYGSFVDVFTRNIIQISSDVNDLDVYHRSLLAFTQNKDMREAYDSTALLFSDLSDIIYTLEYAFGQFKIDFPSYPIPSITTFFGGFNYGVVTYDYNIGIGLENFLGKDSKFYKYLQNKIKIIGVGGVDSGMSAYNKFLAGAHYVQLYTGMVYKGPNIVNLIKNDLSELLLKDGVKNFREIIGNKTKT